MKYIKTFENINNVEYSVGDIVICINNKEYVDLLSIGDHYLVMDIIDRFGNKYNTYIKNKNDSTEYFVNVANIKTNQEVSETYAHRFIPELKYNIDKYNL
jgi:hypothetical protein